MRLKMQVDSAKSYGIMNSEKYSRGRRGAPAKGVGRATGARVQIPLSPFICLKDFKKELQKKMKKVVDKQQTL